MVPQATLVKILIVILLVTVVFLLYRNETMHLLRQQGEEVGAIKNIVDNLSKDHENAKLDDIRKIVENLSKSQEVTKIAVTKKVTGNLSKGQGREVEKEDVSEKIAEDLRKHQEVTNKYKTFHSENLKRGVPESLLFKIEQASLTDQEINNFFHENWFSKPSTLPYNLLGKHPNTTYFSQELQDEWVDQYLKQKTNGIFLEVGAVDGVSLSNTLFFERERNWTGLLIEPNRKFYENLVTVHRKAYTINTCLSLDQKISIVNFLPAGMIGGLEKKLEGPMMDRANKAHPNVKREEVLCIPLFSILEAIRMTHIQLFSLDVEGAELDILKTIPFDKVKIDLFVIEYAVSSGNGVDSKVTETRLLEFQQLFEKVGSYKEVHRTGQDIFYARV